MDPIRKKLFTGMKDYAKQARLARMKKMLGKDLAREAGSEEPEEKKKGGSVVTISIEDMRDDMDRWAQEGESALEEASEEYKKRGM